MEIFGSIILDDDLVLNPNASGEIKNAYLERITTNAESTLALTLGLPHVGRLIFNIDVNRLKAWDGNQFVSIGGGADDAVAQVNLLQIALGAFITPQGNFDVAAFANFANFDPSSATSLFGVLQAIDITFGEVNAPKPLGRLSDVDVDTAGAGNTLRFDGSTWIGTNLQVQDLQGVAITAADLNQLVGVTAPIEERLANLETTTAATDEDLDQVKTALQFMNEGVGTLQASSAASIAATGLDNDGTLAPVTGTHYLDSIASILAGLLALDQQIFTLNSRLSSTRLTQAEVPFTNATVIPVQHDFGYQYCRVLCVNQSNISITPASIEYTDENNLTVTLPAQASGKLVLVGGVYAP